jgi:hypothetical protein
MIKNNLFRFAASLVCGGALFTGSAKAQLTLAGANYCQNFNTISNGLPAGWSVRTNATATSLGTGATYTASGKTWGDTTGEFGNCASTVSNSGTNFTGSESTASQGNCTNRALVIRQTAGFGDPGAAFILNIVNTSGMTGFQMSLDFLMLRVQGHSTLWTVDYGIGNNPTNFTPLATYTDPGVFGATHTNISFGTALDNQGSNVWIRVIALTASTGSSRDDTFGMDNFSLSWIANSASTNPPIITGILITNGSVRIDFTGGSSDSPSSFALQNAGQACDAYCDAGATVTQTSPGIFRAVCALEGSQRFYRIKRQ